MEGDGRVVLREKIALQREFLDRWKQPVEPLLLETLRAIDHVFCEELFRGGPPETRGTANLISTLGWGVNHALTRMIPDGLPDAPFRYFPSNAQTQAQADELLLHAGILERAERLSGWLEEGLVTQTLRTLDATLPSGIRQILVLKTIHPSMYRELISDAHRKWASDLQVHIDRRWEEEVGRRHAALLPLLEKCVDVHDGWGMTYRTTKEIDDHFVECGQIYLRRMWSGDLLGLEDRIGGRQFNEYLGVLVALGARAQKHLCMATILKRRRPELDLRNLLTTFSPYEEFVSLLAASLDADRRHIEELLISLTLAPSNRDVHTRSGEAAWAPVVRSSRGFCLLPLYGLEINPFLFLLTDLEARYPDDWFRAANRREDRWLKALALIFAPERWTTARNVKLRTSGRTVTDIDFLAYDKTSNEIGIFQLKWQGPVGMDNRARRSAGKNLGVQGNKWIEAVLVWLESHGTRELAIRAGIEVLPGVRVRLFIVARYNAFFSGFADQDSRAVWTDWNHVSKVRLESPKASVFELADLLTEQAAALASSLAGESYVIPLQDLAVILNPKTEPEARDADPQA
ncbi:MAG: hypothetical protein M3N91_17540 [Pseudomonadota bacterium]|nr:hypothetical protein [Pseudomonadota bacterium]